jgi:N-acetylglutamate synthase-like GNAT family acetyltransferase
MSLRWIRETTPRWDADKARIIGQAETGIFDSRYRQLALGEMLSAAWWRVEDEGDGAVVGFGWLDSNWGDAEILLAVEKSRRHAGIGDFILARLHEEAGHAGLNYLTNIVRPTHPRAAELAAWLQKRGFAPSDDGRLLCVVRATAAR